MTSPAPHLSTHRPPGVATRRDIVVDGRRVALIDTGGADAPVCVLLHGLAASADYWSSTIPALAASHRVIAVDLPGFGQSENGTRHGIDALVDAVIGVLDHEGLDRVDLMGHSMGTMLCAELAARYPDRVRRLVLTGGPITSVLDLPNRPIATIARRPKSLIFLVEALTAGLRPPRWVLGLILRRNWARWLAIRAYVPHPARIPSGVLAVVLSTVGAPAVLPTLFTPWWWRYDLRTALAALRCPTLVIAGDRDNIAPIADVEEFARIASGPVTVEVLADVGHWEMIENPTEFNRLSTAFLTEGNPS